MGNPLILPVTCQLETQVEFLEITWSEKDALAMMWAIARVDELFTAHEEGHIRGEDHRLVIAKSEFYVPGVRLIGRADPDSPATEDALPKGVEHWTFSRDINLTGFASDLEEGMQYYRTDLPRIVVTPFDRYWITCYEKHGSKAFNSPSIPREWLDEVMNAT